MKQTFSIIICLLAIGTNSANCAADGKRVGGEASKSDVTIVVDATQELGAIQRDVSGMLTDPPRWYNYMLNPDAAAYGRNNPRIEIDENNPDAEGFNSGWQDVLKPTSIGLGWGGDTWYVFDPWPSQIFTDWEALDAWIESNLKKGAQLGLKFSFMPRWLWSRDAEEPSNAAGNYFPYLKTGHVLPPSDYRRWEDLIYLTVKHLNVEKGYGLAFEAWNEPNVNFWKGTLEQYLEMHERTVRAIRRADPKAVVGGPSSAGFNLKWIEALVKHCAENDVPLDYVSWHGYLWHDIQRGHILNFSEQADAVREVIAKYPRIGDPELRITEWAYMWRTADLPSQTFNAAYTIQSLYEMLQSGVSTGYYCGPLGDLDAPDPAVTALKMFNSLNETRLETDIESATSSTRALATRDDERFSVLVWDYPFDARRLTAIETPPGASNEVRQVKQQQRMAELSKMVAEEMAKPARKVSIQFNGLSPGPYKYQRFAMDEEHHDKVMELIEAGAFQVDEESRFALELEAYGLTLLQFKKSD